MNTQKIAVTVPKPLLEKVDSFIKHQGISRSKFISDAVREKIFKEGLSLKESYNDIFSDESICREQLETAEWFEQCGNDATKPPMKSAIYAGSKYIK